jgi:hypothetical protein
MIIAAVSPDRPVTGWPSALQAGAAKYRAFNRHQAGESDFGINGQHSRHSQRFESYA